MLTLWQAALEQLGQGQHVAFATILSVAGSSPRHVGTRFLIRRDGSIVGTIGGGLLEADVQRFAASALQNGTSHRVFFSFQGADTQSTEMICGGQVEVLVEFVDAGDEQTINILRGVRDLSAARRKGYLLTYMDMPLGGHKRGPIQHMLIDEHGPRIGGFPGDDKALLAARQPRVLKPAQLLETEGEDCAVFLEWIYPRGTAYVFGAGHVGLCVAHLAAYVDFRVVVIDDRAEFANTERAPDADEVVAVGSFDQFFADNSASLDEDSYVVIVTRGHAHDKAVLGEALRTRAGYIGMIGSRRKTNLILQALLTEGFSREDLERVHAPIGLPIGGETPQEISISIIGEMIDLRSKKDRIERRGD